MNRLNAEFPAHKLIFMVILTIVSACSKQEPNTIVQEELQIISASLQNSKKYTNTKYTVAEQQAQRQAIRAQTLVQYYFSTDVVIEGIVSGPSGTIEISLRNKADNTLHTAYMLPDGEHFIFGRLISPFNEYSKQIATAIMENGGRIDNIHSKLAPLKVPLDNPSVVNETQSPNHPETENHNSSAPPHNDSANSGPANPLSFQDTDAHPAVLANGVTSETATLPEKNVVPNKSELFKDIQQAHSIIEGNGKKHIYVFFDFNCPACLKTHHDIHDYVTSGKITIHWIPVTVISDDSTLKATSVLASSPDEQLSLMKRFMVRKSIKELGGIEVEEEAFKEAYKQWGENTLLLKKMPRPATPTFAYLSETGPMIVVPKGAESIHEIIENVLNM